MKSHHILTGSTIKISDGNSEPRKRFPPKAKPGLHTLLNSILACMLKANYIFI